MNESNTARRAKSRMPLVPALEVLVRLRQQEIVVTTMGSAREWPKLARHPLDFHYIPSAMGEAPALGLGLALAKPSRDVLVLNGDGAMLMNLGSLVTIVASRATNITLVVLENGVYEVTGKQQTAAASAADHATVDFAGFARAAGLSSVRSFDVLDEWQREAAELLRMPGPRFVVLSVETVADYQLEAPGPLAERLARFQAAVAEI
jgi:thiamine pyrophosphate-dependent acetolactate synthase large subunit-like protein